MSAIKICSMQKEDVKDISEIEKICFSSPWSEKGIETELQNNSAVFTVAKINGITVGYMGMHIVLDECYIANVAVLPEYRRQGIADLLLTHSENKARERNCCFISLEVRVSNIGAISLYEKHGFEKQGERKNFYTAPTENALIMTKYFNKD